jgi:hypothetical protein
MAQQQMDGLVLTRAEMLALMSAVNPPGLIGIDRDELVPGDQETHRALALEGFQQLEARGLVRRQDDTYLFNPEFLLMGQVVGYPQLVSLLIKDLPNVGQQSFVFYQAEQFIVEHTMPEAEHYRLATIPNPVAQIERMAFVLPVNQDASAPRYDGVVTQEAFFQARDLINDGDRAGGARALAGGGLDQAATEALIATMEAPLFSGTVACMRINPPEVVDARNLALLQGERHAWLLEQVTPGEPVFRVRTIDSDEFKEALWVTLRGLAEAPVGGASVG